MPIITLTSDFGTKDYFIGAIKGHIYTELPEAKIVDISHKISPFSINETAYIIKNAYYHFPKGSIHVLAVDAEYSTENKPIAMLLDGHYFICANNGVMSLITANFNPEKVIEINISNTKNTYFLFNFINAACHLARGGKLNLIGKNLSTIKTIQELKPFVNLEKNKIIGNILYIDNFGNAISNIDKKIFDAIGKGRNFEIKTRHYTFTKIYKKYNDIVDFKIPENQRRNDGKRLLLFNSDNYLEVAVYRSNLESVGGASTLLSLKYRDTLTVNFLKKK
ncbi:MAG: SAM-dependent chlorinase/fluorinase [Flavobacteriaceae bacterium]|nr:SAM-dependent chlorinase/fluorinase [Flavobacteriaceae bacterium]